jgi:lipoic acid synthetase
LGVVRFVHPDEFAEFKEIGYEIGLDHVESGPLVRSSYHSEKHLFSGRTK